MNRRYSCSKSLPQAAEISVEGKIRSAERHLAAAHRLQIPAALRQQGITPRKPLRPSRRRYPTQGLRSNGRRLVLDCASRECPEETILSAAVGPIPLLLPCDRPSRPPPRIAAPACRYSGKM